MKFETLAEIFLWILLIAQFYTAYNKGLLHEFYYLSKYYLDNSYQPQAMEHHTQFDDSDFNQLLELLQHSHVVPEFQKQNHGEDGSYLIQNQAVATAAIHEDWHREQNLM